MLINLWYRVDTKYMSATLLLQVHISILSMGVCTQLDRSLAAAFEQSEDIQKQLLLVNRSMETGD